jgi:hypothetical protein
MLDKIAIGGLAERESRLDFFPDNGGVTGIIMHGSSQTTPLLSQV